MKKVLIIGGIIIVAIFLMSFVTGGAKDYWICKNDQWIKQGTPTYPKPIVACGKRTPLPNKKVDCLTQGGVWRKQGPEPFETCNRKARDRGNLCRDNGECEGMCQVDLTDTEMSQVMRGELQVKKKYGQCSVWVVELGCYGIMTQGKVTGICID